VFFFFFNFLEMIFVFLNCGFSYILKKKRSDFFFPSNGVDVSVSNFMICIAHDVLPSYYCLV